MDPVHSPIVVPGAALVGERPGGGRRGDAEAFRRALQQQDGERTPEPDGDARAPAAGPVPARLQPRPPIGRNDHGTAHHVDVIA